jgi:CheY-like chemotaxis protein
VAISSPDVNAPRPNPDDESAHRVGTEHDVAAALHEVSNALTVVLGWIERAQCVSGVPSESARALDVATARARHAQRIVRRAIGAAVPRDEPRALDGVIAEVVLGLEPEAGRSAVHVTVALDEAFGAAIVESPEPIAQILTNLLLNAIAFSPRGTAIVVDGRVDGGSAILGVLDEGPGVELSRRATLFQADATTREGGAGIGLRHAAALAEASGGSLLLVESERGARFELTWPCRIGRARSGRRAGAGSVSLDGARVLIVEDDAAVLGLLDTALGARGATVVSARSSSEFNVALATGPFAAALVDLSPIAEDKRGALRRLREANPRARIIVISGSSADFGPALRDANLVFVRKPFEVAEVLKALGLMSPMLA